MDMMFMMFMMHPSMGMIQRDMMMAGGQGLCIGMMMGHSPYMIVYHGMGTMDSPQVTGGLP
jgi:hypothetical protein